MKTKRTVIFISTCVNAYLCQQSTSPCHKRLMFNHVYGQVANCECMHKMANQKLITLWAHSFMAQNRRNRHIIRLPSNYRSCHKNAPRTLILTFFFLNISSSCNIPPLLNILLLLLLFATVYEPSKVTRTSKLKRKLRIVKKNDNFYCVIALSRDYMRRS